ncbi:hypothetical protein BD770DRAFT_407017 [Pilaira anomala]|nr:hypothetical protein BD770DRAFT_407017 [Pilaira anomala]
MIYVTLFGIPILNFSDYAGFAIGTVAGKEATIRYGSTLTAALYQCDVPYFSVVLRKVFGVVGAAFVDNCVPNMRVAAYCRELDAAGEKRREIYENIMSQFEALKIFDMPEIIDPRDTRPLLCE